jgi:hypothetical protein
VFPGWSFLTRCRGHPEAYKYKTKAFKIRFFPLEKKVHVPISSTLLLMGTTFEMRKQVKTLFETKRLRIRLRTFLQTFARIVIVLTDGEKDDSLTDFLLLYQEWERCKLSGLDSIRLERLPRGEEAFCKMCRYIVS